MDWKMIPRVFMEGQLRCRCVFTSAPDMILGVWISTKPLLVRVSLKSWHTPDCNRKTAWLVVVFKRTQTHAQKWHNYHIWPIEFVTQQK